MKTKTEEYISIKEASELINVSKRTIERYMKDGILSFKRFPNTPRGRVYILKNDIPAFARKI